MSAEASATEQSAAIPSLSVEQARGGQNFPLAVIAGIAAAAMGAILWAAVTIATEYKLGLMALTVGYIVGQAIRTAGQGIDAKFGYLGAACGFLGCAFGDLLSNIVFYAQAKSYTSAQMLNLLSPEFISWLVQAAFSPMDLLFLAIGVYEGYKFSFRYRIVPPAA